MPVHQLSGSYHDPSAAFVLKINLHADNGEPTARLHWREATGLPDAGFYRTFVKQGGTQHLKSDLPHGVCQVRVRRCADDWHRTMEWVAAIAFEPIDRQADSLGSRSGR